MIAKKYGLQPLTNKNSLILRYDTVKEINANDAIVNKVRNRM